MHHLVVKVRFTILSFALIIEPGNPQDQWDYEETTLQRSVTYLFQGWFEICIWTISVFAKPS